MQLNDLLAKVVARDPSAAGGLGAACLPFLRMQKPNPLIDGGDV